MRTFMTLLLLAASHWLLAQNETFQGELANENYAWQLPKSILKHIIGGGWRSVGYDVRVESIMDYEQPQPDIGFRAVLVKREELK